MASTNEAGPSTSRSVIVKFQPPPLQIISDDRQGVEIHEFSRENSLNTPMTPGAGPSGLGMTPRDDRPDKKKEYLKKLGHRRVLEGGEITYKKVPTSQLMGAIQLGIANAIGSLASKPERDLLMQDFSVIENVYFPTEGSSTTPSHSFSDFRFKTYAPIAFRFFRDLFHIKPADFLASLCADALIELSNPGASGSIFYISNDDQFIIKTVQHKEAEFLQNLLAGYYMNLNQNPRTLLPKFFGLYCYQSLGKNVRLLVMNNLLPSTIRMHQKYDLKGSTYKRRASKHERAKGSPTLKDLDFMEEHPDGLYLEASTYEALMRTIQRDCLVLESFKIMDYSLLMGIHNLDAPQKETAIEEVQLHLDGEHAVPISGAASDGESSQKKPDPKDRKVVRQKTKFSAWESIQTEALPIELGDEYPNGGIPARSAKGERLLLFIGIIDILQNYRLFKKFEHAWKSVLHDGDTISVHRPSFYASRFQDFMRTKVFKKIPSLDAEVGGEKPSRRFRSLVQSYIAFKHSPSKRKSRERRGTASSTTEERQRTSTGDIVPITTGATVLSARPDLVPTGTPSGEPFINVEHRSSIRRLTFDTTGRPITQRQDTHESKEAKKIERLFASSNEASSSRQRSSTLISNTDPQSRLSYDDETESKPLETTL